jgi:cytochrome c-type biogenesis protein CcmE
LAFSVLDMAYRDELEQAHARIAQLEEKLQDATIGGNRAPRTSGRVIATAVGLAVVFLFVGGGAIFLSMRQRTIVATHSVSEVLLSQERHQGVRMRVRGNVVVGSYQRSPTDQTESCLHRFDLEAEKAVMHVQATQCVLPDSFSDKAGVYVIAEGDLSASSVLTSDNIIVLSKTVAP